MKVSVFVPFYSRDPVDGLGFLKIAIQSVINQTYKDWNLTVLDDQCPFDGVDTLVHSFDDPRIAYRRNEKNLGQAANWNRCIKDVQTEYYSILHADDELMPHYLETMVRFIESNQEAAAAFCRAVIINESGTPVYSFVDKVKEWIAPVSKSELRLAADGGLAQLLRGNFIMCPTVMYRRSKIGGIKYAEHGKWIPDLRYWTKLLLEGRVLIGTPQTCYRYRRHSQSATAICIKTTEIFEEEKELYHSVEAEATKLGWHQSAKRARSKSFVKLRTLYYLMIDLIEFDFQASRAKLQFLRTML